MDILIDWMKENIFCWNIITDFVLKLSPIEHAVFSRADKSKSR
jgi:hypothetical protein